MHICIVGTGAAGWIACNYLKNLDIVDKITIIGSSKMPPIGVGESNVTILNDFLSTQINNNEFTLQEFIKETDAAVKYGVMYDGWSKNKFIHYFKSPEEFDNFSCEFNMVTYGRSLANKEKDVFIHDLMGKQLFENVTKNNVLLNQTVYNHSFHFDAGKFINFFQKNALKNNIVSFIDDEVLGGLKENDEVQYINTKKNNKIIADFFIFATGDYKINEKFLEIKYKDYSHILLTNKAVVYPLKYTNKREEFHPYTVAKTMKNGWRWITPTWSRIGTGYVFSNNHISEDQAIHEFKKDIGSNDIEPFVVDFAPKSNPEILHSNWCTLGMASGFLEPLDAPGLSMTINSLMYQIDYYLHFKKNRINEGKERLIFEKEKLNTFLSKIFDFWCTFILSQYKTSLRNDTEFWKDHKAVRWDVYENAIKNLDEYNPAVEKMMLYQTFAGKNIQWKTSLKIKPYKTKNNIDFFPLHHLNFIEEARKNNLSYLLR